MTSRKNNIIRILIDVDNDTSDIIALELHYGKWLQFSHPITVRLFAMETVKGENIETT